jgi:hypothetical protein
VLLVALSPVADAQSRSAAGQPHMMQGHPMA